jgi:SAM-dependent methyltransferase
MRSQAGSSTSDDKRSGILAYWNRERLCSPESSTSRGDPNLAQLDNAVENQVLGRILSRLPDGRSPRCIDVGAGYGRFTQTLRKFYSEVVLLEAADNIYRILEERWSRTPGVTCVNATFEDHADVDSCGLILASGVVYLYDDQLLGEFLAKARSALVEGGILVLRDFVSLEPRVVSSAYVENGSCHYRSPAGWSSVSKEAGFELLEIRASKPRLSLLRRSGVRKLLAALKLTRVVRSRAFAKAAARFGDWELSKTGINTTFIVMRAL